MSDKLLARALPYLLSLPFPPSPASLRFPPLPFPPLPSPPLPLPRSWRGNSCLPMENSSPPFRSHFLLIHSSQIHIWQLQAFFFTFLYFLYSISFPRKSSRIELKSITTVKYNCHVFNRLIELNC